MTGQYREFQSFSEVRPWLERYSQQSQFELSAAWLEATREFMMPDNAILIWHALLDEQQDCLVLLPLVHHSYVNGLKRTITPLTSFYSSLVTIYQAASSPQQVTALLTEILTRHPWDTLDFGPYEANGTYAQAIQSMPYCFEPYPRFENAYLTVQGSFESYWQARPSQLKNTVKRKTSALQKQHEVAVHFVEKDDDFEFYFEEYCRLYSLSWKGEEYSYPFIKQVCQKALVDGHLRMAFLALDGQNVAVQIWFLKAGVVSIFKLAYDPDFARQSVGSLLSHEMFKHAFERDKVKEIEYGVGSERYKADWMTAKRNRMASIGFNRKRPYGAYMWLRHGLLPRLVKGRKQND